MMRPLFLLLFLLFLTFQLPAQELDNASFSVQDSSVGTVARGWRKSNNRIFYDTANAHTAPGCIYIYNNSYVISTCSQSIAFNPGRYRKYKLRLFIRTESRKGFAGAWVKARDGKGVSVYQSALPEGLITGKTRWKPYETEFYVTADVAQIEVGLYFTDKGKAWFDDITIEELPTETKKPSKIAEQYLGEVYNVLQKHCWYKDSVDLEQIYKNALQLVPEATSKGDCYEGVAYMLDRLGDRQGRFYDPATARNWVKEQRINDREALYPTVSLDSGIAHILLPGVTAGDKAVLKRYADTLHHQLSALRQQDIRAWIVDLRENVGGNATAMLAAIGPLLNKDVAGKYIGINGDKEWKYKDGKTSIDTTVITVSNPYKPTNKDLPVAVLTSEQTYGAAELIFVAFRGRGNSRSFGEITSGATAYEKRIVLSDGAMLFFSAGMLADTKGWRYNGRIIPDAPIRLIYTQDLCLMRAKKWLREQSKN